MFTLKKILDRNWYLRKALVLLSFFVSDGKLEELTLIMHTKLVYRNVFKKPLHLRRPKSLNEKLIWLSLFWKHPLKAECADKVRVRDYVREKGLEDILTPVIGFYADPDEIPFDSLPMKFVLKCNHGCAYNIIVKDKAILDIDSTKKKLRAWLSETYGVGTTELHYAEINPRMVLCEDYLCAEGEEELVDYKIHCINGHPEYIQVCYDRDDLGIAHRSSYSMSWEPLHYFTESECVVPKPASLSRMVECAEVLSKDFPYVRVDFYDIAGKAIMSEMTFTPFGNMIYWVKDEVMDNLGKKLVLPKKYKR